MTKIENWSDFAGIWIPFPDQFIFDPECDWNPTRFILNIRHKIDILFSHFPVNKGQSVVFTQPFISKINPEIGVKVTANGLQERIKHTTSLVPPDGSVDYIFDLIGSSLSVGVHNHTFCNLRFIQAIWIDRFIFRFFRSPEKLIGERHHLFV